MAVQRESLPVNLFRHRVEEDIDQNKDVKSTADRYFDRFNGENASVEARKAETTELVNEYYDLVTDFYEYGWGQAFHFAPRYVGETFYEGLARHEYFLALNGGWKRGDRILDIGCGVGGPARNIARLTRAVVTGINNNAYQISRAKRHDARVGLQGHVNYLRADFCNMPIKDNEYDGAYAIEATCHATDKVKCYGEIFRCLKPGAVFCCYEWIITDKYDDSNEQHRKIRHSIELGNGLPTLETAQQVVDAMKAAGFVVEDAFDKCEMFESGVPKNLVWYDPFLPSYTSLWGLKATPFGRFVTSSMCSVMEFLRLAPKGSRKTADILEEAAAGLVLGGKLGIFTPAFFVKGRKPVKPSA